MQTSQAFKLIQCDAAGRPVETLDALGPELESLSTQSATLFAQIGFVPPWVSYIAAAGSEPVGGGAFVGAPRESRVEIAYFTLEAYRCRGFAGKTAHALVQLAHEADPALTIIAKTLPEEGPSTIILSRLGFHHARDTVDADAGVVWEWQLPPHRKAAPPIQSPFPSPGSRAAGR